MAAKEYKLSDIIKKIIPKTAPRRRHLEINLVPDIKDEMIKTLKLRNLIFFICIVVASAGVGTSIVFLSIAGGQQAIVGAKQNTVKNLSDKVKSYSDLDQFLTIKDQLGNLSAIGSNKKVLSRVFNVFGVLFPRDNPNGTIDVSELNINLAGEAPTFSFDAQANAPGGDNGIDYNTLDSFKKTMEFLHYDYGRYVDKNDNEIPAYCIVENGLDGATLYDTERGYYAYWLINGERCKTEDTKLSDYTLESFNDQSVVRIWRTPQFSDWYKENPKDTDPQMTLDGTISNVQHFNSSCITYYGTEVESTSTTATGGTKKTTSVKWDEEYSSECLLVPGTSNDPTSGINITDSSNGRDAEDQLVLRFSAIITFSPEVFKFSNYHLLALPPKGRYNVTDSFVQIQSMFAERASDCAAGDTACNNTTNQNGGN